MSFANDSDLDIALRIDFSIMWYYETILASMLAAAKVDMILNCARLCWASSDEMKLPPQKIYCLVPVKFFLKVVSIFCILRALTFLPKSV